MKMRLIFLIGGIFLCSCNNAPPPKDPATLLKENVSQSIADYNDKAESSTKIDENYKMDVQKTDSLISPYVGTVEYRLGGTRFRVLYAFQNNKWEITDQYSEFGSYGDWLPCPVHVIGECENVKTP